jgi:hypothetical protein
MEIHSSHAPASSKRTSQASGRATRCEASARVERQSPTRPRATPPSASVQFSTTSSPTVRGKVGSEITPVAAPVQIIVRSQTAIARSPW